MRIAMKEIVQVTPSRLRLFHTRRPAFCRRGSEMIEEENNFHHLTAIFEVDLAGR